MKVTNLTANSNTYTSNVYLIQGDWNTVEDVNTIIDTGRDPAVFYTLKTINTGLGKKKIEKIILTHNHYDHGALAPKFKELYSAEILAFHKDKYVDRVLKEGMMIKAGDKYLEVIHTPGHTHDSICLWESKQGILFTGDTNIDLRGNELHEDFLINSIRKLARLNVKIAYPGHGEPIDGRVNRMIRDSLINAGF